MNGRLYFACDDGSNKGEELCTSDGTGSGTTVVRDINPGSASAFSRDNERSAGVAVGDKYVFRALVTRGGVTRDQLWVSGGCATNTYELLSIQSNANANLRTFRASPLQQNRAYFFASGVGPQDDELWVTDGTPQGTDVAVDACSAPGCGGAVGADDIGFLGSKVFFSASAQGQGRGNQLWEYDSATKQGKQSAVLNAGANNNNYEFFARGFAQFGSVLFFVANDGTARINRLWRTDGTTAQLVSRTVDGITTPLVVSGSRVFFQAKDTAFGNELHAATAAGAQVVKDLILGEVDGWAEELTDMGGYVLFSGDKELYRSDGTASGTELVKDINAGTTSAGPGQSYPRNFVRAGATNKMYFSGDDGRNGRELWVSDGTPAGTVMVMDINPGGASSSPQDFTLVGPYLYFSAETAAAGRELWRILVDARVSSTVPPIVCPATQMSGGTWNPAAAVGACCQPNACTAVTAAQCASSNGRFEGAGTRCESGSCSDSAPASGICCDPLSTRCWPSQPKANCDALKGVLKAGTGCSVCWSSPPAGTPAPAGGPVSPATGNCCANGGCLQFHTQQSCAQVNVAARFIGADQCIKCFQTPTQIDATCTPQQVDFCKLVCGGGDLLANCACSGNTVKTTCNGDGGSPGTGPGTPSGPGTGPVAPPQPPVGTPFAVTLPGGAPATVPGGAPVTGVNVPVTQPNGQPATQPGGAPLTNVVLPVTDASGNVPNPGNTLVLVPVTNANGAVVGSQPQAPGVGPGVGPGSGSGPGSNRPCTVLPEWCAMVCGNNPVAVCTCANVSCGKSATDTSANSGVSKWDRLLSCVAGLAGLVTTTALI